MKCPVCLKYCPLSMHWCLRMVIRQTEQRQAEQRINKSVLAVLCLSTGMNIVRIHNRILIVYKKRGLGTTNTTMFCPLFSPSPFFQQYDITFARNLHQSITIERPAGAMVARQIPVIIWDILKVTCSNQVWVIRNFFLACHRSYLHRGEQHEMHIFF